MSKSLIPVLTLNGIALGSYTSSKGKEYATIPTNTLSIEGKLFRVFSREEYVKETLADGRVISAKVSSLMLLPVKAETPTNVPPAVPAKHRSFETGKQAKTAPEGKSLGDKLIEGLKANPTFANSLAEMLKA